MSNIIIQNITKSFKKGAVVAVKDLSLEIKEGELFGLIGADGAGKTTLFRILTTLLLPDSGEAFVNSLHVVKDYKPLRRQVGYMPSRFSLYQDLTVEENLNFFATIFNTTIEENYSLIKDIYQQIEPFKNRRAGKLSGGMKQKLALCCALVHRPKVLFLDEPTTGVDTVSRKEFWQMLQKLKEEKITIVVSTPYMDEATMCERIGLMQNGQLMSVDTPQNMVANFPKQLISVTSYNMSQLLKDLRAIEFVDSVNSFGECHHVTLKEHAEQLHLNKRLVELDHKEIEMHLIPASIEDCFINLMSTHGNNN